jgi:Flp pilus assembly protein TadG
MNDRDQKELITSISGVMPMLPLEKSIGRFIAKDTSAVSAVEFGLVAPLFLVFMLTVFDAGLGFYRKMQVENAAQAGAAYASQRGFDIGAIQSAVLNATNFSGLEATPAAVQFCGCPTSSGIEETACQSTCSNGLSTAVYVRTFAQGTYNTVLNYPLFPNSFTFAAQATVRLQ